MDDLPAEIYSVIASFCVSYKDVKSLLCACQFVNKYASEYFNLIKSGNYTLNKFQLDSLKVIDTNPTSDIIIKVPMSGGKTALGLTAADRFPGTSIIISPSDVIDTWVKEYENMGLSKKIKVAVAKYGKINIFTDVSNDKNVIYLIPNKATNNIWKGGVLIEMIKKLDKDVLFIIDEAHTKANQIKIKILKDLFRGSTIFFTGLPVSLKYKSIFVMLSAQKITSDDISVVRNEYKDEELEVCIPTLDIKETIILDVLDSGESVILSMCNTIKKHRLKNKGRVIVFVSSFLGFVRSLKSPGSNAKKVFTVFQDKLKEEKLIEYKNIGSLDEFKKEKSSIMFASTNKIRTGVNITCVDSALFFMVNRKQNKLNPENYRQTLGRLTRVNSKNMVIPIHNYIITNESIKSDYHYFRGRKKIYTHCNLTKNVFDRTNGIPGFVDKPGIYPQYRNEFYHYIDHETFVDDNMKLMKENMINIRKEYPDYQYVKNSYDRYLHEPNEDFLDKIKYPTEFVDKSNHVLLDKSNHVLLDEFFNELDSVNPSVYLSYVRSLTISRDLEVKLLSLIGTKKLMYKPKKITADTMELSDEEFIACIYGGRTCKNRKVVIDWLENGF